MQKKQGSIDVLTKFNPRPDRIDWTEITTGSSSLKKLSLNSQFYVIIVEQLSVNNNC